MNTKKQNILYIHGFNSSPLSMKAEQTREFLAKNYPHIGFYCPQLAVTPNVAIKQLEKLIDNDIKDGDQWFLMGSSLGGYFSSYLSEKYNIPAVLINPAIKPYELLEDYIGEQINPYTQEVYQVDIEHIHELKNIEQKAPKKDDIRKNNYLVMVQTGDEVLDYQQAIEKYQHCQIRIEKGGDHSFIGFEQVLPKVADFFQLK